MNSLNKVLLSKNTIRYNLIFSMVCIINLSLIGCKKLVEVDVPATSTTGANAYSSNDLAISAVTGIYTTISGGVFATGEASISLLAGLSADELTLWSGIPTSDILSYYYSNKLYSKTTAADPGTQIWRSIYPVVFVCNSAIEGLTSSNSLTPTVKAQLLGEAKFMRAFLYFYLVNLYGDVPLLLSTDYKANSLLARAPKNDVYLQIIEDLNDAEGLLSPEFVDATIIKGSSERVRPNKWAALALLARVYLYMGNWIRAEEMSTKIIDNSSLFDLIPLASVFLKNSKEAIWQLQPVVTGWNTLDARMFILPASGPNNASIKKPVFLNNTFLNSFEFSDNRRKKGGWVDSVIVNSTTYFFPTKYRNATQNSSLSEYLMVFRIGEQYLIRAEAKAQLNKLSESLQDLNKIRKRAGLNDKATSDKSLLLTEILQERRVELFTEWGHRWFDMKRTNSIDAVMSIITPLKANSTVWQSYQQLYPLPLVDIQRDVNLSQNPGY